MHDVVPMAVRNAVSAATATFTTISINRFFFITLTHLILVASLKIAKKFVSKLYKNQHLPLGLRRFPFGGNAQI